MKTNPKFTNQRSITGVDEHKDEDYSKQDSIARLDLLQKKLSLLMSYETKIKSLEERMDSTFSQTQSLEATYLEEHLKNSNVFQQSLSKLQSNVINTFSRLQQNVNSTIQDLNLKFSTLEDSFLDLFRAQEKQMTKLTNSQVSLSQGLRVVEQLTTGLSNRSSSSDSSHQALLNLKIQKHQNESNSKLYNMEAQLHKMESRIRTQLENICDPVEENQQKIEKDMLEMKQNINQIKRSLKEMELTVTTANSKIKSDGAVYKSMEGEIRDLITISTQLKNNGKTVQSLNKEMAEVKQQIKQLQEKWKDNQLSQDGNSLNDVHPGKPQLKQSNPPQSGLKPAKKDIFISEELTPAGKLSQDEVSRESYGVGIKGLRKSKQKEHKQQPSLSPNLISNPNKLLAPSAFSKPSIFNVPKPGPGKKNLPPVQQPIKPPSKQSNRGYQQPMRVESEEQEQLYVIDGYIADKNGQFLLDRWGQPIAYTSQFQEDDY